MLGHGVSLGSEASTRSIAPLMQMVNPFAPAACLAWQSARRRGQ
jgi:hypothetical protein